jgi:hypothetical protein
VAEVPEAFDAEGTTRVEVMTAEVGERDADAVPSSTVM